ncbi:chlorophyllase/cutinase-like alpha/beta fold protein [Paenibacillus sp. MMS20-IR301]|uniref:poly(ethylene terephthalate) hydrolase family protein n=1 Tax=Paenibacillus sp. MMS20-IR301 TaxID=2895946 RepID=UPI0028E5EBBB|nr:alpha/beta hydrolase [Paenibacillus sp. MMS20-IR301]WNS41821.1 alpha/beta hydrolase [Paenibacillus sp. MMS20-IR301]
MGMDLEYAPLPQGPRLHKRILSEIGRRIIETYKYDTPLWRFALCGPWALCTLAFTIAVMGIPTGLGSAADIMLAAAAATLVMALAGNLLAVLFSLTGLRIPHLFTGTLLSTLGAVLLILYYADLDLEAAALLAVLSGAAGGLAGLAAGLLRTRRTVTGLLLTAVLVLTPLALAYGTGSSTDSIQPAGIAASAADGLAALAADPGQPGSYAVRSFTYGSGHDLHRTEYGDEASLLSTSVDATEYISSWPTLRTLFWGFDPGALPLNAKVWMPEGDGPYPLVLMVHGNHMMEDYSEGGYAYLGELLASRGFIAVTLDENFLNYSAWSGIPDNDFKVRTWMILKHLQQIASYAEQSGTPFYQKVDYDRTALLGHSRGGQAVAMAADAARWFTGDPALAATKQFHIRSVIALAPTDKAIDSKQASLVDVNYLTLQGARDGDVHDFYGDRQYMRTSYTGGSAAFKSSLYIADANHSQFNTDWGLHDQTLPTGLFLDRTHIMDGAEQRQIAKVYVSAFLETTLHGNAGYQPLFRDYRSGAQWLPDTTSYYNRFQSGAYIAVANYEEDRKLNTVRGGTATVEGLDWSEEAAKDRESKTKPSRGIVLERSSISEAAADQEDSGQEDSGQEASYTIQLSKSLIRNLSGSAVQGLTFSLANHNSAGEPAAETDSAAGAVLPPDVEVELTDSNDIAARLPLDEVMDILPLPQTEFTISPWLEERIADGKFGDPSEAVFQTYELPFERFLEEEPELDPDSLTEITFYLQGENDKIMLDDIGFYEREDLPQGLN